ncbi:MAG: LysM peptidoglycan-binding domain-containing protein [Anaerolineaceae bacterium]|nr:LysM peptidoglycan-binding domain-containing protein [Anaerolineaceae bacterium]MCB9100305.1 LysM peptidoglycan-binding domain-containing protein [Anaerolineales bacterium]
MEKARIVNLTTNKFVECQFNPNEYTISKQNQWTAKTKKGMDVGETDFGGGQPATLQLKLFFDTSEKGEDVRVYTNKIWELMLIDNSTKNDKTKKGEPPQCQFQWGKTSGSSEASYFTAVIKQISQKFVMFLSDGTPVRATLDVSFQQYKDDKIFPPQNPTSRSAARKVWVVVEGQTLDWIAYREYGSPAAWRHIAETNGIDNPFDLQPGQILNLVPLP